jgi:hypothetical protein
MKDLPIYSMPTPEGELLLTPVRPASVEGLKAMWERLEEAYALRDNYVACSACGRLVPTDPRGNVLDSAGRCLECQS